MVANVPNVLDSSTIGLTTLCLCLLLATVFGADLPKPATSHSLAPTAAHFYTPEEMVQICAEFPALMACQDGSVVEKRKSAYMRFGRSTPEFELVDGMEGGQGVVEKRKSAYMRFGKRFNPSAVENDERVMEQNPMEKRKSAYMRFGKRKSAYMRFGKRSQADDVNGPEMAKRKSAYMRFGKRSPMGEENQSGLEGQMEKRKSAYMRFGKRR